MRNFIKNTPFFGKIARYIYRAWINPSKPFLGSEKYWIERYKTGGNSGDGSYNQLAKFKADIINKFITDHKIISVIEYGCGDGNQLSLAKYPKYIGFDVSFEAVSICSTGQSGLKAVAKWRKLS